MKILYTGILLNEDVIDEPCTLLDKGSFGICTIQDKYDHIYKVQSSACKIDKLRTLIEELKLNRVGLDPQDNGEFVKFEEVPKYDGDYVSWSNIERIFNEINNKSNDIN